MPSESTSQPPPLSLQHREFVQAYGEGRIIVNFDPQASAKFLSAMLMLPLFVMPVLGIGVALALSGWIWTGLLVIALGIIVPRMIKRGAPHFLMQQILEDETIYRQAVHAGILHIVSRPGA
ncbi:MAG: hypothetical protein KF771_08415 [Burkholderiales bacterium]|nr:hypothetical protein [Burkholderiales bacterium]